MSRYTLIARDSDGDHIVVEVEGENAQDAANKIFRNQPSPGNRLSCLYICEFAGVDANGRYITPYMQTKGHDKTMYFIISNSPIRRG